MRRTSYFLTCALILSSELLSCAKKCIAPRNVTLFVMFLRRAYAILAIRTSVIVCSLLEPGDEEQEQTHAAEEWHDPRATTWCSHEDELPTGRILAVCGTRSMDQFRAGRTPSAPLGAGRNVGAGLCHLSVHCELCCDSSDSSRTAPCSYFPHELCHLQSGAGTAAVPSFSQHGRIHLLAQVARTSCTGGLVLQDCRLTFLQQHTRQR